MNNYPRNINDGFPQNKYGPAGINDNNFNRKNVPSNIYPPNGGMLGSPFGRYNPLSTNERLLMNNITPMNNFNEAYKKNEPIIEKINYTNKNNILHNNIAENVLDEHIVEYRINIDSLDRDIKVNPDPFSFTVRFNGASDGIIRSEVIRNGEYKIENKFAAGAPRPVINKEFRNIKYIKLDSIILPQFSNIIETENSEFRFDPNSYLIDDRFIILGIDELTDCNRNYSTSDNNYHVDYTNGKKVNPPVPFGLIFPDSKLGNIYYTGTPYNAGKIYKSSLLGNIDRLSIKLYDSCGIPLKYNNLFSFNEIIEANKKDEPVCLSDIRHPLNKKIQVHLSFIIGVVESQINTNTKFYR